MTNLKVKVKVKVNHQNFYVIGYKLTDNKFEVINVYDNNIDEITNVIEAFNLWDKIENLTLEQIQKDEKI